MKSIYRQTFYLDIDDVCFSCNGKRIEDTNKQYGTKYTVEDLKSWGGNGDPILDEGMKFYRDPEWIGSLQPLAGAVEFIEELKKRGEIFFCTAVNPNCMEIRSQKIKEYFDVDDAHIIMASTKNMITCDFFLDDNPKNLAGSHAKYPVLFRRPWNYEVSGCMTVSSYEDFLCFVDYVSNRRPFMGLSDNSVVCLVGPSGCGKTDIMNELLNKGFNMIDTYTTADREGYLQLTETEFKTRQEYGFFAETTVYGGCKYGISTDTIQKIKKNDKKYVCRIDIGGAMALKNLLDGRVAIAYVDAPKEQLYRNLLKKEVSEDEKVTRLMGVEAEIENRQFCDVSIRDTEELLSLF